MIGALAGPAYPTTVGSKWFIDAGAPPQRDYVDRAVELAPKVSATARLSISLLQANVLTLHPPRFALARTSPRMEELDQTFFDAGAHVIFVQEARTQTPGLRDQLHYWVLVGGAQKADDGKKGGQYGCEVWVAKILRDDTGRKMK